VFYPLQSVNAFEFENIHVLLELMDGFRGLEPDVSCGLRFGLNMLPGRRGKFGVKGRLEREKKKVGSKLWVTRDNSLSECCQSRTNTQAVECRL
jgi:hypothetical protein